MSNRLNKHKSVVDELAGEEKKKGRPKSRRATIARNLSIEKELWERLQLAAILKSKTVTELLHESIRAYIAGNFNKTDLDMLAKIRQDNKD